MEAEEKEAFFDLSGELVNFSPNGTTTEIKKSIYSGLLNEVFASAYRLLNTLDQISFKKSTRDRNLLFFYLNTLNSFHEMYNTYRVYIFNKLHDAVEQTAPLILLYFALIGIALVILLALSVVSIIWIRFIMGSIF